MNEAESYRQHLGNWGIQPAKTDEEVYRRLSGSDITKLRRWRKRLIGQCASDEADFWRWTAHSSRFGPIHSLKWMEILTSGVWAAKVVEELHTSGAILDLGCNAGYWCSWMATRSDQPVVGIDQVREIVEYGRVHCRERAIQAELTIGDYASLPADREYNCAVSLQGLTSLFHRGEYHVIAQVGKAIQPNGFLVLVDEPGADLTAFTDAARDAGFSIHGVGLIGGLGINFDWRFYPGLVLRKDGNTGRSVATAVAYVSESLYPAFRVLSSQPHPDWTYQNTAYQRIDNGTVCKRL